MLFSKPGWGYNTAEKSFQFYARPFLIDWLRAFVILPVIMSIERRR